MNDFSVRITRRTSLGDRSHEETIDIDFGKAHQIAPPISGTFELAADPQEDSYVAGDAVDMQEALQQISSLLGCTNTLDDMLHAIDALTTPRLEWSGTLCKGERVKHAAAVKACAALGDGWRLPTRAELLSLVDDTRSDPAIDTTRFPDTKSGAYWTSTPLASDSSCAWIVLFNDGGASYYRRGNYDAFVRAVRAVPAGQ